MAEKATDDYRKADADINLSRAEVEKVGVKCFASFLTQMHVYLSLLLEDIRWIEKISFSWTL